MKQWEVSRTLFTTKDEKTGEVLYGLIARPHWSKQAPLMVSLPGGKLERDETPAQAAAREVNEEVNVIDGEGKKGKIKIVSDNIGTFKNNTTTTHVFFGQTVPFESTEITLVEENKGEHPGYMILVNLATLQMLVSEEFDFLDGTKGSVFAFDGAEITAAILAAISPESTNEITDS